MSSLNWTFPLTWTVSGNDKLAAITAAKDQELRVDLWDWDDANRHADYSTFKVGPASEWYKLTIGGFDASNDLSAGELE